MLDLRIIFYVIGILLSVLGLSMLLPAMVDMAYGNADAQVFFLSAGITLFVGVGVALSTKEAGEELTLKGAFLMTTLIWLPVICATQTGSNVAVKCLRYRACSTIRRPGRSSLLSHTSRQTSTT